MKLLTLAAVMVSCVAQAAFDADTIAFYPFMDQAAGSSAETDDAITNAVTAGAYDGVTGGIT